MTDPKRDRGAQHPLAARLDPCLSGLVGGSDSSSGFGLAEQCQPQDHSADQHARTEHVELVASAAAGLQHETC